MTEPTNSGDDRDQLGHRVDATLHRLRNDLRQRIPVPALTGIQEHARRRQRRRRALVGGACAAVLVAVAAAGAVRFAPLPGPAPTFHGGESASTNTTAPPSGPDHSFTRTDWSTAAIELPPHPGCPTGTVRFTTGDRNSSPDGSADGVVAIGPATDFPRVVLHHDHPAYGDLTGDGRAEAVLTISCAADPESSLDGEGQLLVVAQTPEGTLRGLGYAGPRGGIYHDSWVSDRTIYIEVHPWHGEGFPWAPGAVLQYRWDGAEFRGPEPATQHPPIIDTNGSGAGTAVQLGPVADRLGCPDGTIRFGSDYSATVAGYTYDAVQPDPVSSGPHLLDLDGSGHRRLLLVIGCAPPAGDQLQPGLAVLEPVHDGLHGVAMLLPPETERIAGWEVARPAEPDRPLRLRVTLRSAGDPDQPREREYRWDGGEFVPAHR